MKRSLTNGLSCLAFAMALTAVAPRAIAEASDGHPLFREYGLKVEAATADLREYMKSNPGRDLDSLRANVLDAMADGAVVGKASDLTPARKRKLDPVKLYELCRKSSLVFGKMDHSPEMNKDSAYTSASAVVLTKDGVCATNYHVVADLVLSGALAHKVDNQLMRFVMDFDGNVYPLQGVLYADPVNDMAIIKVDTRGRQLTPAAIGGDAAPGTTVYCLANPSGAYFHFTDGMVSNCARSMNKRSGQTKYILEITSDYGGGASGGPIFDECGNLVAIVSSTYSLYANPQQYRNFQMAYKQTVPVFLIKECFTE